MVVQQRELLRGKVVIELGAGCGLPSIAAAIYSSPSKIYLTDIHEPSLRNARFNVSLNSLDSGLRKKKHL
jgi:predicted nicotinamide N-methyase